MSEAQVPCGHTAPKRDKPAGTKTLTVQSPPKNAPRPPAPPRPKCRMAPRSRKSLMTLNEYQNKALDTAIYPLAQQVVYPALKLAGEAGEVANKIGKCLRGDYELTDPTGPEVLAVVEEIGDVLWYCAALAHDLKWDLKGVAEANLAKLARRKKADVLRGSGDDR